MKKHNLNQFSQWWFCDNILCRKGQIGLLKLDFPQVFILVRDEAAFYNGTFEDFCNSVAEVNFLDPDDRKTADLESILTDAWNYAALTEREEERLAAEHEAEDDEDGDFDYKRS